MDAQVALRESAYAQAPQPRRYCFDRARAAQPNSQLNLSDLPEPELLHYLKALVDYVKKEDELLLAFFKTPSSIYLDLQGTDAHAIDTEISLGLKFIAQYYSANDERTGQLKIAGILAHEKSHIFQFYWKFESMLRNVKGHPVKWFELHADYLAGAYMAWRDSGRAKSARELSRFFFDLGDRAVTSDDHHGTENERLSAYTYGYFEFLDLTKKVVEPMYNPLRQREFYTCKDCFRHARICSLVVLVAAVMWGALLTISAHAQSSSRAAIGCPPIKVDASSAPISFEGIGCKCFNRDCTEDRSRPSERPVTDLRTFRLYEGRDVNGHDFRTPPQGQL